MSFVSIAYAAHTAACTFLLDEDGICRRIVVGEGRAPPRVASRCVGAQYVASLDPSATGCLIDMPRVGTSMLFARVDTTGRVSLVRTGIVTRFEALNTSYPFDEPSIATSAPHLAELDAYRSGPDLDYEDLHDRTRRRPIPQAVASQTMRPPPMVEDDESEPTRARRPPPLPSGARDRGRRTLQEPPPLHDDEDSNRFVRRRGMLPRQTPKPPPPPPRPAPPVRGGSSSVPKPAPSQVHATTPYRRRRDG